MDCADERQSSLSGMSSENAELLQMRAAVEEQKVKAMEARLQAEMARAAGSRASRASRRSLLGAGILHSMEADPYGPFVLVGTGASGSRAPPVPVTLTAESLRENVLYVEAEANRVHALRMEEQRHEFAQQTRGIGGR